VSNYGMSRRTFLAATAAGLAVGARAEDAGDAPKEKLNLAAVGIGGMGKANLEACRDEHIVALCDVDDKLADPVYDLYRDAKRYKDFRNLLDAEADKLDGVIIATPDHTHAVVAMAAIERGLHVFCQKPLAHSIGEVRKLTMAAREAGVQTQMGNQGHSSNQIRRLFEWVEAGVIGPIERVYAWSDRPVGGDPWSNFPITGRPDESPPVPATLDWDLWLGPAPERPYHPIYTPMSWRGFYDFGTGPLGDMGCHILDPAFWALKLGHPQHVEATTTHWEAAVMNETYPRASIVRYQFPARENMPPVRVTWFDGRLKPPIPPHWPAGQKLGSNGALYIGTKGIIVHGSHGASNLRIYPESLEAEAQDVPETLPRIEQVPGVHEKDWLRACRDGVSASSSFEYGGPLTEMVLLGVLAIRMPERRLEWDPEALRIPNDDEANALVDPPYREGWSL